MQLLLGESPSADGEVVARCFGIAALALGIACWPLRQAPFSARALAALQLYNAGIALYLAYLGAALHIVGPLLWPAVALHTVVTGLLLYVRRNSPP